MMLLLKPWRNIASDLKNVNETWIDAYHKFANEKSQEIKNIIEGIQFYHACRKAADDARELDGQDNIAEAERIAHREVDMDGLDDLQNDVGTAGGVQMTEEGLEVLKRSQIPIAEDTWGKLAVFTAQQHRLLPTDENANWILKESNSKASCATGNDFRKLLRWQQQLDNTVNNQAVEGLQPGIHISAVDVVAESSSFVGREVPARVDMLEMQRKANEPEANSPQIEEELATLGIEELKTDQRRAYEIVAWHHDQKLGAHIHLYSKG
jgi:hypothetical protein